MVSLDRNTLYIIIGVIIILIILMVVFMKRRGSKKGPSSINQYLAEEAKNKKIKIVENADGRNTKIPHYKLGPEDRLKSIREATSELEHKNAYYNQKVEERIERLDADEKQLNLQKQLKNIDKIENQLNSKVKPKKDKKK